MYSILEERSERLIAEHLLRYCIFRRFPSQRTISFWTLDRLRCCTHLELWHSEIHPTYTPHKQKAPPAGFEPATSRVEAGCSNPLSYGGMEGFLPSGNFTASVRAHTTRPHTTQPTPDRPPTPACTPSCLPHLLVFSA